MTELYKAAGTTDKIKLMDYVVAAYPITDMESSDTHGQWMERAMYSPDCFFKTDREAMDDIEKRITECVLPYFDKMAERFGKRRK